jgi:hypothetical protein
MAAAELAPVSNDDEDETVEGTTDGHVLVLGEEVFTCGDKLPVSTLIRYADNDLLGLHKILVKLVPEDEHERMWDAFEDLDEAEVTEAIGNLVQSYSERPTGRPSPSRAGSKSTRRK